MRLGGWLNCKLLITGFAKVAEVRGSGARVRAFGWRSACSRSRGGAGPPRAAVRVVGRLTVKIKSLTVKSKVKSL